MSLHIQNMVIKLGVSTITNGNKRLCRQSMFDLAQQIAKIHKNGQRIIIVTTGAIAAGREIIETPRQERYQPSKQILAAVGQTRIMHIWSELFSFFDILVGQLLITRHEFSNRTSYLNLRDSLTSLLNQNIIPIINENDPVVSKVHRVGDNDHLSALIANMVGSHLLVLLTDQKGLYNDDPARNPNAELIPIVAQINDTILNYADGTTGLNTGSMLTKLQAAQFAVQNGIPTVIASSKSPDILLHLASGQREGTLFLAETTPRESRKRWLLAETPVGILKIDQSTEEQLRKQAASLTTAGIVEIGNTFDRGSIVQIQTLNNQPIAVGLTNYTSKDLLRLLSSQNKRIEDCLGYTFGQEVIHRDHLVLLN